MRHLLTPARASGRVLWLLCLMYLLTYVDRVNISTAAAALQKEMSLSNTQLGFIFSAFAYPYLLFQVVGGSLADRFGARRTLLVCALVWSLATLLTGLATGFASLVAARLLLGLGEGATFPAATRAMADWTPPALRGFAQGITHAFARLGNALTPPLVVALTLAFNWRGAFLVLGAVSLLWVVAWALVFRDDPRAHPAITEDELARLPQPAARAGLSPAAWRRLAARMAPVTVVYFCYGWTLWLFLSWVPLYFLHAYHLDLKRSGWFAGGVFLAGVLGDTLGGVLSDALLRRTGNVVLARLGVVVPSLLLAMVCLLLLWTTQDAVTAALCLSGGFFFAELTIGPMWAIPMDIAPAQSGTASGLMNAGSALAAILSPVVAGWLIDRTGDWNLPFAGSIALLALGAALSLRMRPQAPFRG